MPREVRSWERGHLCPRNAVRPLFVFRKHIAGKDARAPRIGWLRNISIYPLGKSVGPLVASRLVSKLRRQFSHNDATARWKMAGAA
jgi:hypothetical protein